MVASGVQDIEYIAINTDAKALNNSKATTRIQIGAKLTKGRGAGNKPAIGQQSAEENKEEIEAALKGADMVFITAGMGGGTGTGAAPVVAKIAQEAGILTVAVVTKPFAFEREQKMAQAEKGIMELKKYVDSLIVIPNEKLLEGMDKPLTMRESFALADDILKTGVKSISDLIVVMKEGILQQIGKPQEVYDQPANLFVAKFLGTPPINVFSGKVTDGQVKIGEETVLLADLPDQEVTVGIRPEGFVVDEDGTFSCALKGIEVLGRDISIVASHPAAENASIRAIVGSTRLNQDMTQAVFFSLKTDKVFLFDAKDGSRIETALKRPAGKRS